MAGAGTGPAAMPMAGGPSMGRGFGFAGNYGAPAMPPAFNFAGGPMNIGRSGQVKPSGQYSGGFMGQGPAIQPAAPAPQMQTVQVNPNTGRPFASSREQMQYLLPDANLSTGRQLYTPPMNEREAFRQGLFGQPVGGLRPTREISGLPKPAPMATQRPGVDVPGINLPFRPQPPMAAPQPVQGGRDFMPTPPMMTPISRPQPTPISEGGPQVPAGASPGGNFFTDDQGRQMYQPPMPKAPPGMMIPQVMPDPIEVGPQAPAKPQPSATPPFDPAGGPVSQPMKQAPIRREPIDFGPSDESVFERSARGVRAAMGATGTEMGFQPSRVQGFSYEAPTIASQIEQFRNPFEQQVVEGALGDIERQRQMQANQLAAQFQAARGFGGSRQAIQEAELARSAMEQGAGTAAQLRQQGFGQALQAAAQQAQMGQRAQEFGLGQSMQAQLANQAAKLAGSQQRMRAASQLANLANLGFGMGQTVQQQMAQQGALQQQLQQQIMNAARQQFEGFRNYPAQALGYYAQALGATPVPQSSTTSRQPGLFDYLTLGLSL